MCATRMVIEVGNIAIDRYLPAFETDRVSEVAAFKRDDVLRDEHASNEPMSDPAECFDETPVLLLDRPPRAGFYGAAYATFGVPHFSEIKWLRCCPLSVNRFILPLTAFTLKSTESCHRPNQKKPSRTRAHSTIAGNLLKQS